MKKILVLFIGCLFIGLVLLSNGCKKDSDGSGGTTVREDFKNVFGLASKGWYLVDNSSPNSVAPWQQGQSWVDKAGQEQGFRAYSYKDDKNEYAFAGFQSFGSAYSISSWMITPAYQLKNGDKISFYTRTASTSGSFADRLQVRLNEVDNTTNVGSTATSVGNFTLLLKDINENLMVGGYPQVWTKYEITISGLSAPKQTRLAFRYFPDGAKSNAIGIDLFQLTIY